MKTPRFSAFAAVALAISGIVLHGQDRVALVIGNNAYPADGNFSSLANCAGDAALIKGTLAGLGFRVFHAENATRSEMDAILADFENAIPKGGTAVFYFAGHGIEFEGKNYLMGSNAKLQARSRLGEEAMDAETFASAMILAGAKSSFLFLDCCREVPGDIGWLTRGIKKRGLAEINIDGDIIIAYAAKPGQAALDGQDGNSPYAKALARWIPSGLKHGDLFDQVRKEVHQSTGGAQRTWESGSFLDPFYFKAGEAVASTPSPQAPAMTASGGGNAVERYFQALSDFEGQVGATSPPDSMKEGTAMVLGGYLAIPAEGLPGDLAEAHRAFVSATRDILEQSAAFPEGFASGEWHDTEALIRAAEGDVGISGKVERLLQAMEKMRSLRGALDELREKHLAPIMNTPRSSVADPAALDRFVEQLTAAVKLHPALPVGAGNARRMDHLKGLSAALRGIDSAGVPAEIATAFEDYRRPLALIAGVLAEMPPVDWDDPASVNAVVARLASTDPRLVERIATMGPASEEFEAAGTRLDNVLAKQGIAIQ